MKTLVWFRHFDLRLQNHRPLQAAIAKGAAVPVFVLEERDASAETASQSPYRTQSFLDALYALHDELKQRGSQLVVMRGDPIDVISKLVQQGVVDHVVTHRSHHPDERALEAAMQRALGNAISFYDGTTLMPPEQLRNQSKQPYVVFTAFARAFWQSVTIEPNVRAPRELPPVPKDIAQLGIAIPTCDALHIQRNDDVPAGGEGAAVGRLKSFIKKRLKDYQEGRDELAHDGTSRLSADLRFGTISPATIWHAVEDADVAGDGPQVFLKELIWREFAKSTLWDRPELVKEPFNRAFANLKWRHDEAAWQAWVEGRTGYPVVDAACRQLLTEGFVHNRARMIAASFLTKHLLIDYRRGEAHYMRYLIDGDVANNNMGWQWSAGCGCDAQPYFRIFNPVLQGQKFDKEGTYVRRYVPELASMPNRYIHRPWEAPDAVLRDAKVRLGVTYPKPIVEHKAACARFLNSVTNKRDVRPTA